MKHIAANRGWLAALVIAMVSTGAAVTLAQRDGTALIPEARSAKELSNNFRNVARVALPSVVMIETRGKIAADTPEFDMPFEDGSPFDELFRQHPQLRDQFRNRRMPERRGAGSGFIIDADGTIVTNSHVVNGADKVKVRLQDGREFIATNIRVDARTDVAILQVDAGGELQPIALGDSDQMEIGDWVLAVGSPFGLELTVTAGIISAKGRGVGINEREDYLQTDAAINPGNSGGPLLNLNGEVIGINTAISSRSGGSEGVAFTVPINMARWVIDQLKEKGQVERAYLGVLIQEMTNDIANVLKLPVGKGVLVGRILPDSPAQAAGLQRRDLILQLDGKTVGSPRQLQGLVERLEIGKAYDIKILRDGEEMTLPITMKAMPKEDPLAGEPESEKPEDEPSKEGEFEELGLDVQTLTPEIAKQLKSSVDKGVVVTSVKPGSAAEDAGLSPGMIIVEVGSAEIESVEQFRTAIDAATLSDGVLLSVQSGQSSRFIVLKAKPE